MINIEFKDVTKTYRLKRDLHPALSVQVNRWMRGFLNLESQPQDHIHALHHVTFKIEQGESVGILGANGAGKTSLLRLISNITKPTSGAIHVNGRVAPLLEVGAGFHPELTGRENIFLNGVILGMRKNEIKAKLDEIIAFAELERFIDSPIKQYSSGMYMRLGFSVAIHSNFDVLIADEILAVGDHRFKEKCIQKFNQIKRDHKSLVLVSHATELLLKHCKRGLIIQRGAIEYDGDIHTACEKYHSLH